MSFISLNSVGFVSNLTRPILHSEPCSDLVCLSNAQVDVLMLRRFPTTYLALINSGVTVPPGDRPLERVLADARPAGRLWRSRIISVSVSRLGLVSATAKQVSWFQPQNSEIECKPSRYQVSLGRLQEGASIDER
jgi:hypothetical protein